jgi:regulator of CtrA degradation
MTSNPTREAADGGSVSLAFGQRLVQSEHFSALFKEGMALVERTASYLDGPGRRDAKGLKPPVSVIYATESMRLTTRLLEAATWLLVQRALNEGEISPDEAARKKGRLKLKTLNRTIAAAELDNLPAGLRDLMAESFRLTERVLQLERSLTSEPGPADTRNQPADSPVALQLQSLERAFARRSSSRGE